MAIEINTFQFYINFNSYFQVVPESKLAKIEELCSYSVRFLYSVEIASLNGKSLNLPEPTENKL